MTQLTIGFIGLGRMGGRLAARLVDVGDLTVFDASAATLEAFEGRAARGSSIADVGRKADIVGICVRNDEQVNECVDALLPVMPAGSVLMIHSTVDPETVRSAARRAQSVGVDVVDAAVTVTRYDVTGVPFVLTMVGGDEAAIDRARPALEAYSTETTVAGPSGAGMALKIINNLVSLVQIVVAEEAYRLAGLTSVPAEALTSVMKSNGILTPTMMAIAKRAGQEPADRATLAAREIQASNGVKDLALAEELAKSVYTTSATATFAKSQYWAAFTASLPTQAT